MKHTIFIFIFLLPFLLQGQDVLNEYVKYGIENNLSLQQKLSGYQKSIEALKEARGLFYPNISFNARYTVSEGGHVIDFPIGDLQNSILLVDFTNQLRRQGTTLNEAIVRAGEIRFLPVLLTTLTAIGGLLPIALGNSNLYSPLA